MNFQIRGLDHKLFEPMFAMKDEELLKIGGLKMIVDENPGYPCRVSLEDANVGEEVILVPFEHHKTNSPYQAKGPIFIRKGVNQNEFDINEIPKMLKHRLLSFRGYDTGGIMRSAKTGEGENSKSIVEEMFMMNEIKYIHIHNSSPGCFNCEVNRV